MAAAARKLTPVQVRRIEISIETLQRAEVDGYRFVISELENELDYLRRAARYLEGKL